MTSLLPSGSFFGDVTRTDQVTGFRFAEAQFTPETVVPVHAHETAGLYVILDGVCAEKYGRSSRLSEPTSMVFHPATHEHAGVWKHRNGLCFNVEISPERLDQIKTYAPVPVDAAVFSAGAPIQTALRLYREFRQPDSVSPLAMEGMVLELLAGICRSGIQPDEPPYPRWLKQATDLLEARFCDNLTLAEIAADAGIHPSHLARVFRRCHHCSIGDYIRNLRMEYICRHLASSDLSLAEIALAAGFADQSHFTKSFKQAHGITPAEYRRHTPKRIV